MGRSAGRHLPGRGRDGSGTAFRQNHAICAERRRGTDHRAKILRVGHAIQSNEQRAGRNTHLRGIDLLHGLRALLGLVGQIAQRRVFVGLHFEDDALMVAGMRDVIHLQAVGLQQVESLCCGDFDDLARAVIMLDMRGDIQLSARHANAQRLEDGVAADDQIGAVGRVLGGPTPCGETRIGGFAAVRSLLRLVCLVIDAILCLRGRTLASKRVTMFSARTLGRAFLVSHTSHYLMADGAIAGQGGLGRGRSVVGKSWISAFRERLGRGPLCRI